MTERFNRRWSEKHHDKWAALHRKGRWRFVLGTGVGMIGSAMFLLMAVVPTVFQLGEAKQNTLAHWLGTAAYFALVGAAMGLVLWSASEKMYAEAEAPEPASSGSGDDD